MDQFLIQMRILNRILEKKLLTLTQILNITENQQTVLSSGSGGGDALKLYAGMMDEKRKLIDEVNQNDKIFETAFGEIKRVFETEAPKHAGLVKRMQDGIKRVTALDARIRVQEARNNAAKPVVGKAADNMAARKHIARIYENNKRLLKKQPLD